MTVEEESKTPALFYLIVGAFVLAGLGVVGGVLYFSWGKLGLPTVSEFGEEWEASRTGNVKGAIVVEGNSANYLKYVNRDDVFVMVNYYSKFDQLAGDLQFDLKKISARHEGKVVLMNVEIHRASALVSQVGVSSTPEFHLMHAGDLVGRYSKASKVAALESAVVAKMGGLSDPVRQAASEVDPYAESLRGGRGEFVPDGVAPQ